MAQSRSGATEGTVNGWHALHLTNGVLAVTVLPGKGADIYEITDLAAGAELRTPARTIITSPEAREDTARLEPGQRSAWPLARRRGGGEVDLSRVPGPEAASHDDVFLTDLDGGWAEVGHPAVGLAFRLEWDPGVFGWIISWQPYGGARAMPLRGAYALGIEPWAAGGNLEHAVAAGDALRLAGHAQLETTLTASIRPW